MQHVWSDHVSRAEGLIDSKFTEHHRNIALATKGNAAICTVGLASLNLSSAGYHACAALFHSETGFSIHPGAGNGNCIAMREAFGSIKTKRICAFLAMTRVSHAVLLYSISPYAVIGKIYDSCAKEHTSPTQYGPARTTKTDFQSLRLARDQWGKVRELLRHARHHILTLELSFLVIGESKIIGHVN